MAATSATNAWAVGTYFNGAADQTLVEHWNGTAWTIQPTPNPGGGELDGIAATSSTNAWAVGGGLILHWNGTAWKAQKSPNPHGSGYLFAVTATSSRNAWAVGDDGKTAHQRTLIEHRHSKA